MRNLISFRNFIGENDKLKAFVKCTVYTEPTSRKPIYLCAATASGEIYTFETNLEDDLSVVSVVDLKQKTECFDWSEDTRIVDLQQVYDSLWITLNCGIFLTLQHFDCYSSEIRDILLASWNYDFDRTVVITSSSMVGVLNVENFCEQFAYVSLQDIEEESNKFVNVGWGSSETQFRGSEGKITKRNENSAETNANIEHSNNEISVVWKKDGSAFAVSYKCSRENVRKVKIFNQNGILLNMVKNIRGLESAIDWCPSINLIFNVQKLPNKDVVCFIEENGLRHGEFQLPNVRVISLRWNNPGTILATLGEYVSSNENVVLLWTTSNYKWYIKQELKFRSRITHMQWDDQAHNRLHLVLQNGVYRMYDWIFHTLESAEYAMKRHRSKIICNINGVSVGVTPYGGVFRPPSMAERVSTFPSHVNTVIFGSYFDSDKPRSAATDALLYLSNNTVLKYNFINPDESIPSSANVSEECYYFTVRTDASDKSNLMPVKFSTPAELNGWLWLPQQNRLYFCWSKLGGHYFCRSVLKSEQNRRWIVIDKCVKLSSRALIITTINSKGDDCLLVHLENGFVLLFKDEKLRICRKLTLPEPCQRIVSLRPNTFAAHGENRNLYINNEIKWHDVGSFYWQAPFLVAILSNSRMVTAKLSKNQFEEVSNRRVEPKSHLITIVGDQLVLEMSRGNIELVIPRPFVANKMASELSSQRYYQVFKLLRKQRINLNVIFDHDRDGFYKNAKSIVQSIEDPSYLTLFAMELENANVAQRMFPWKYTDACESSSANKVQSICETLLIILDEINCNKFVLPKIALLTRLERLADAARYAVSHNEVSFLFQLVDAATVYNAVIASYDLACALKIAEFSKMDPGDYLPFIKELQKMDENYRKFTINRYLGKNKEALEYLTRCQSETDFQECIGFIEKHHMYSDAYEIFVKKVKSENCDKQITSKYIKITSLLAQNLEKSKLFDKAAYFYEKIGLNDEALECYAQSGNWHSAVSLIDNLYLNEKDPSAVAELYAKLHSSLVSKQSHEDAAFVAFVFMKDALLAAKNYITARKYRKALDAAKSFGGGMSTTSMTIKSKLLQDAKCYADDFATNTATLQGYASRLRKIKEIEDRQSVDDENDRFSSNESFTSSESSTCSTRSSCGSVTSSAKRARRRERKLWNLKPGNPREKISIMDAVRELIEKWYTNRSCVVELCEVLYVIDEPDVVEQLRDKYDKFEDLVSSIIRSIWNRNDITEEGGFKDLLVKCPPDLTSER